MPGCCAGTPRRPDAWAQLLRSRPSSCHARPKRWSAPIVLACQRPDHTIVLAGCPGPADLREETMLKSGRYPKSGAQQICATDLRILDVIRGLSALYVLLYHARQLLTARLPSDTPLLRIGGVDVSSAIWGAFGFGSWAVLVFFAVSGFCIHWRQANRRAAAVRAGANPAPVGIGVRNFAERRFVRLYPPLLAALSVTALSDYYGVSINRRYYESIHPEIGQLLSPGDGPYSVSAVFGALTFQTTLAAPQFGVNTPLWSLSFEFWFYTLYPAVLALISRFGAVRTVVVTWLISVCAFLGSQIEGPRSFAWILSVLSLWSIWVGGAGIAEAYARAIRPRCLNVLGPAALAGLLLTAWGASRIPWPLVAQLVGPLVLVVLAAILLAGPHPTLHASLAFSLRLRPLGDVSYSLYLIHYPLLVLLGAWWLSWNASLPRGIELAALGVLGSLVVASACWLVAERPFMSRHRLPSAAAGTA